MLLVVLVLESEHARGAKRCADDGLSTGLEVVNVGENLTLRTEMESVR